MSKTGKMKMRQRSATLADAQFGAKVRALRIQVGMSQDALAGAIGVSFQQVQKYEKGVNRVSYVRAQQIAKALGCTMGDLSGSDLPAGPATTEMVKLLGDNMIRRGSMALSRMDRDLAYKFVSLMETTESSLATA